MHHRLEVHTCLKGIIMIARIYLNDNWMFTRQFSEGFLNWTDSTDLETVRIPHTCKELPYNYLDEKDYQMVCGYRRLLPVPAELKGKTLLLTFEGAAHSLEVFINGKSAGAHHCGYTAFTCDITDLVEFGAVNKITLRLDTRESLNVPPFGFVIDYLTYGGVYRDVSLDICESSYIEDVFICPEPDNIPDIVKDPVLKAHGRISSEVHLKGPSDGLTVKQWIRAKGEQKFRFLGENGAKTIRYQYDAGSVDLWDVEQPSLYEVRTDLLSGHRIIDQHFATVGFRKAVFQEDGFYLNGRRLQIRGLNRHQSYPYVGYAMPDSMQEFDARILKEELGVNAVRTSHYPQAQSFVNACDEKGLLVFTEFPGWQHIGDQAWKDQAQVNLKEMILQYRNHPSIILWGVRINESVDDEAFYQRTNAVAHALDPSRQTGGVRCYKKGIFQEDVFTYNDFSHAGKGPGIEPKADVTADKQKPYLVTEYNGHMFPTKSFDSELHRQEHALRHARVLNDAARESGVAGSFGWCMFDYNTHKDFGSGDRICYHGVLDMFRNPKLAAAVYACQSEDHAPVLEVSSAMDIGERPAGTRGDIYIFTNADSVRMYRNDDFIKEFRKEDSSYPDLLHGPILIDDYLGDLLVTREHFPQKKSDAIKEVLNEAARKGLPGMSKSTYAKVGRIMLRYRMKQDDLVALFNKYIGDWGGTSTTYRFQAIKDGKVILTRTLTPATSRKLTAEVSHTELTEVHTYDVAAVRIRITDENGNVLPFAADPVILKTSGPIEIIGPSILPLRGGMGGTYVKTTGAAGDALLTLFTPDGLHQEIRFNVKTADVQ